MITPAVRPSMEIKNSMINGNSLFLESEEGMLRITVLSGGLFRVSFDRNGEFSALQGEHITEFNAASNYEFTSTSTEFQITTDSYVLTVNRTTSAVHAMKKSGEVVFAETPDTYSRLDSFEVLKPVINENVGVVEVKTADGVKKRIGSADMEYEKTMFHTKLSFEKKDDEFIFGLGSNDDGLWNLNGNVSYLHQANMKIAIPVIVSSEGYGIFMTTQSPAVFDANGKVAEFVTYADYYLDYYLILSDELTSITKTVRRLTGKASMLPKWAFGYVQSQERYETQDEILNVAKTFKEKNIPVSCIVLDWFSWEDGKWGQKTFDASRFPNPSEMVKKLHDDDIRFMISIWPTMSEGTDNNAEFKKAGSLLPGTDIYDAFSEEARALYTKQLEKGLACHGIDAWWCDSSEPVTPEWEHIKKPYKAEMYYEYIEAVSKCMPVERSNAYGLYHAKGVSEWQRGYSKDKRVVNLTRSGYPGSQKYGVINWSGDISASWETLRRSVIQAMQYSVTSLPYWTFDVGAFFVKRGINWYWDGEYDDTSSNPAYMELYLRMLQFACFLPMMRAHGTDVRREPWEFEGKEDNLFYDAIVNTIKTRYALLPYIYSIAGSVWRSDDIMIKPLCYVFGDDKNTFNISTQFMLGNDLMVCPVLEAMFFDKMGRAIIDNEKSINVYLPEGSGWYDMRDHKYYEGGQTVKLSCGIDQIPVFAREGAIVPIKNGDNYILKIFAGKDGEFRMYDDAGDGYAYEGGEFCITTFTWDDGAKQLTTTNMGYKKFADSYSCEIITK